MRCLRFYTSKVAKKTYKDQTLGLGLFTIQGFETQNKVSKNTLKRSKNCKGNIMVSNLKRIWDVFSFKQNTI